MPEGNEQLNANMMTLLLFILLACVVKCYIGYYFKQDLALYAPVINNVQVRHVLRSFSVFFFFFLHNSTNYGL